MVIIRNHFTVSLANEECILVHALTGAMVVMDEKEFLIFSKWKKSATIEVNNEQERQLLKQLLEYRFVVTSSDEEDALEAETLSTCKQKHLCRQEALDSATFVLTYACNFNCPYCYEKRSDNYNRERMTEEMVDKVFELHKDSLRNIRLYGGEPLLPSNENIIRYIIKKAPYASYGITTNGYYLEEFYSIFKDLDISEVMVTLDGQESMHNQTRILHNGEGTFIKIMSGIALYLQHRHRVKIRMNISSKNIDSCLAMKENLISNYHDAYIRGDLIFEMQPLFETSGMERDELEQKLYFPQVDTHIQQIRDCDNTISNTLSPLTNVFARPKRFTPKYSHCDAERSMRFYDPNGLIYSCILSLGNEKAAVGRYFPTMEMKDRSILSRNIETIEKCRVCIYKFLCGGGCANGVIGQEGNVLVPNCTRTQYEIEYLLPKLYAQYTNKVAIE